VAPAEAAPAAAPSEPPAVRLVAARAATHSVADSFLTEEPDLVGLLSLASALATARASCPIRSSSTRPGSFSGKLDAGGKPQGTFYFDGKEYRVELSSWNTPAPFRAPSSFSSPRGRQVNSAQ